MTQTIREPKFVAPPVPPTVNVIRRIVAQYYEIDLRQMYSKRRAHSISHPRQVAIFLTRDYTPYSLPHIARMFGKADHTVVMHSIKAVRHRLETDEQVAHDVGQLRGLIEDAVKSEHLHEAAFEAVKETARRTVEARIDAMCASLKAEARRDPIGTLKRMEGLI